MQIQARGEIPMVPFVRLSKDMSRVELWVGDIPVDSLRIKGGDHHKVMETMIRRAKERHRFPLVDEEVI